MYALYEELEADKLYAHKATSILWSVCKVRTNGHCIHCRGTWPRGATMFRPITNTVRRSDRACLKCIRKLSTGDVSKLGAK